MTSATTKHNSYAAARKKDKEKERKRKSKPSIQTYFNIQKNKFGGVKKK